MKLKSLLIGSLATAAMFTSCSDEPQEIITATGEIIPEATDAPGLLGFYVLNEGNMGSNKCTLDYFNYKTKSYIHNIYTEQNPSQALELGDVGSDIAIFGDKLYIAVNGSHKVEVLDAKTAVRVGQVNVSSPRYLASDGNWVFVSSYVGGEDGHGSVVKIDPKTLKVVATCSVGYQPEEIVVTDGKVYVANSVNMTFDSYDNTISVVDINSFKKVADIEAAINMHHLRLDSFGNMWATSRGNYYDVPSSLVFLQKTGGEYSRVATLDYGCSNLVINSNKMYYYAVTYDENWNATNSFFVSTINAAGIVGNPASFLSGTVAADITAPYCIAVRPDGEEIFVTDAKNYVSSGELKCFSTGGELRWSVKTGDIPGHIAFLKGK